MTRSLSEKLVIEDNESWLLRLQCAVEICEEVKVIGLQCFFECYKNAVRAHSHDSNDRSHDHIGIMDTLDMLWTKNVFKE